MSITTHGHEKIGIDVEGNATKGFLINQVEANSVADASGKIETGGWWEKLLYLFNN